MDEETLTKELARLQAARADLASARGTVRSHARKQLDTMPRALDTAGTHRDGNEGVLVHRRHKALLHERRALTDLAGRDAE